MKREKIEIDRKALFSALAALRRALLQNDTTGALRQLDAIYRLLPIQAEPASRAR